MLVAQLGERKTEDLKVAGSTPVQHIPYGVMVSIWRFHRHDSDSISDGGKGDSYSETVITQLL